MVAEDGNPPATWNFLCRIVEAVIKAGATTSIFPTRSAYGPRGIHQLHAHLIERVPNSDKAVSRYMP